MSKIIFLSTYLKKIIEMKVQTKSAANNIVIYNSIDTDFFKSDVDFRDIIEKYKLKRPVFLQIGHLVPKKAPEKFVEGLIKLDKDGIEFSGIIVGSGPLKQKLTKMVLDAGLDKKIHLIGEVEYEKIPAYHACADVLILPSLAEGLPTVVIEAMSSGTAVIATDIAGTPEIIKNKQNGILIKPDDADELYRGIKYILKGNRYRSIRKRGRGTVLKKFSWKENVKKYIEIYND
jgi:glycosyltransferase involved in cell wall biosynthesis